MKEKKRVNLKFNLGDVVHIECSLLFGGALIIDGKVVGTSKNPKSYLIRLKKDIDHSFAYDKELLRAWSLKTFKSEFLLEELIEGEGYIWTHILAHTITKVKIISSDPLLLVLKEIRNEINSK